MIKFLVAEKDRFLREKIAGVLSHFDDVLTVTQTGHENDLIRIVDETAPDVFIVDVAMASRERNAVSTISNMRPDMKMFLMAQDCEPYHQTLADTVGADGVLRKATIISELRSLNILSSGLKKEVAESCPSSCILLADDDAFYREKMKEYLDEAKLDHKIVSSGAQAYLEFVSSPQSYRCVVLDVHMTNVNGFAAGRMIRSVDRNVPVIFVSSDNSEKTIAEAESLHCHAFIQKPFSKDAFLDTVGMITDTGRKSGSDQRQAMGGSMTV